jgi:predicted lactoylglutathione lyase
MIMKTNWGRRPRVGALLALGAALVMLRPANAAEQALTAEQRVVVGAAVNAALVRTGVPSASVALVGTTAYPDTPNGAVPESAATLLPAAPELYGQVTFINCEDLATMSRFYRTMLGKPPELDMDWVKIYPVTSNVYVGLIDKDHGTNRPSPNKPVMLSFLARTPQEVDQWYQRLKAMNAEIKHVPAWGKPKNGRRLYSMMFKDPEGYYLEVFAWAE